MQMQISENEAGIKDVILIGRLDMQGTSEIEDKFAFNVTTDGMPVLVDLSGVDFMASIGMRMLVMNAKSLSRRGGKMAILQPQPAVRDSLLTAGIDLLIPLFEERELAVADLKKPAAD